MHLKKELGVIEVFCIASGAMISSGLFILPAVVYKSAGPSIILAYLLAAVLVVPALFAKAELATAMPKSGGDYFFIYRSLGPLFGTFAGFATWFSLSMKSAFALVGIGIFLEPLLLSFFPDFAPGSSYMIVKVIAVSCTLFFTFLNIVSVEKTGKFQVVLVFILIGILLFYIFRGMGHIDVQNYVPFSPDKWKSFIKVIAMIFISFGGLTKVASVAGEVKNPGKILPQGMFASFFVVTILYVLTVFVTVGVLSKYELIGMGDNVGKLTPISTGAAKFSGQIGFIVLSVAAMFAFITTGNAGLLASSRSPLGMSEDNLIPSIFAKVSYRFKTPFVSIIVTSLFMIALILFLNLEQLVKVASTMKLILFALVNISVILMRESRIASYKPQFKSPFYPYMQIAGLVVYCSLIVAMGDFPFNLPLTITLVFFIVSSVWYAVYTRRRDLKQSALIRIVERITNKEIKTNTLSDELRDILFERDGIIEDRFDKIIKAAEIIDLKGEMDSSKLFDILSEKLSQKFHIEQKKIHSLMQEREDLSTTAISKGLAIPHIIIDGEGLFDIIVARSKEGIDFGPDVPPVHIVFALAGSNDERHFHLTALMAIAQIVQNKDFIKQWKGAESPADLKNSILLAERIRKGNI